MARAAPTGQYASALTLGLASLGFVSLGLPDGMLGVAWPSIRATFGLPLDALGLLLTTFASGYFISSAVSGRMLDRFGIGRVLAGSCALTATAVLGYALSPAWPGMVALGFVLGLGAGTIDAGLNTYAAVAHGARALNWMHAAFGIGAAIGPLVMTAILGAGLSWNLGYVLVAGAQLGLAAGYALTRDRYEPFKPPRAAATSERDSARELLRNPLAWISLSLFFVYVGVEAGAGQWSFSLFTLSRGTPVGVAGVLVSAYWASMTIGRVVFGLVVSHVSSEQLLRACMLTAVLAACVIWLNVPLLSWVALGLLGLVFAPIFPVLIAETPARLGAGQTANAVGLQVAAAVLGGAGMPAVIGLLAARISLEVVGPCLVAAGLVQLGLYELLIRRVFERPRSGRSRSTEVATFPPGA